MKLKRRIIVDLLLLLFVVLLGSLGYVIIEHWSFFDSLYMTVITLTTIGFGEIHPLSPAGRVFTLILIVTGIGTITYTLGSLSAYFFGQKVYTFLSSKRMQEKIMKLNGHFIICGASEVGLAVASELSLSKFPVLLIDRNEEKLKKAEDEFKCLILLGDATQDEVLEQAKIDKAEGLVASFGNDHENVYLIMAARQLNPKLKIYAKVKEEETTSKLKLAGADELINPYKIGGMRLASLIIRPNVVKFMDTLYKDPHKLRIEETTIDKNHELYQKDLTVSAVEQKLKIRVVAFKKADSSDYQYLFSRAPIHFGNGDSLFYLQAKADTQKV